MLICYQSRIVIYQVPRWVTALENDERVNNGLLFFLFQIGSIRRQVNHHFHPSTMPSLFLPGQHEDAVTWELLEQ
jgi:hypothetical protein